MRSLWLDETRGSPGYRREPIVADAFTPGVRHDVVVIGAGLTGLTSALLFARAGLSVAVLEARHVGAVTTGNTTAKVSLLQGTHLTDVLRHSSLRAARAYVEGNREGKDWLLRYCHERGVPAQLRDAYTYAGSPSGEAAIRHEFRAATRLGLDVTLDPVDELPFPTFGAVRLADQAQIHPMDVLSALAADLRRHGGVIHEATRVVKVRAGRVATITTTRGTVTGATVILATGIPILDRGLFFAKLQPQRSYALAFRVSGEKPQGMYLSADSPTRSLRTAPINGEELLLVGGNGHVTGRARSPEARVRDLRGWTERMFPGAELTHRWAAQDYEPIRRIPYVGRLPRGGGQIFVATGFDKWGMANGVAASLALASMVLGGSMPWATSMQRSVPSGADVASFLGANAAVGAHLARGYARAWSTPKPRDVPEGAGVVTHVGLRPTGVCKVDGVTSRVSAACPHLGGVLSWNDAELSWDCPLHGSRFSAGGERLEGPAVRDLASR